MGILIFSTSEEALRAGFTIESPNPDGEGFLQARIRTSNGWGRALIRTKDRTIAAETVGSQSEFASFLKTSRLGIPRDNTTLGSWERLPVRRGRRVTQEEIAEAVGISRNWYRRLESGDAPRASAKLLDRIAKAFQFTPEERMNLFLLGIPELARMRAS